MNFRKSCAAQNGMQVCWTASLGLDFVFMYEFLLYPNILLEINGFFSSVFTKRNDRCMLEIKQISYRRKKWGGSSNQQQDPTG